MLVASTGTVGIVATGQFGVHVQETAVSPWFSEQVSVCVTAVGPRVQSPLSGGIVTNCVLPPLRITDPRAARSGTAWARGIARSECRALGHCAWCSASALPPIGPDQDAFFSAPSDSRRVG